MSRTLLLQGLAALGTLALALAVLNPFGLWMPSMFAMLLLALLFVVFCVFAVFVVREDAADEREAQLRTTAGRTAFLVGAAVLLAGIVVQDMNHALDPWLVWALVSMVAAKLLSRAWSDVL